VISQEPVLSRALELAEQNKDNPDWQGFEWKDIPVYSGTLNRLVAQGLLEISYRSRKYTCYKPNKDAISDLIGADTADLAIPTDLFSIIIGYDDLKNLFFLSLAAPRPVHVLMHGPPATAKTLFLSELSRLSGARYALGGTSSRAGIIDFLLDVKPRFLILDELEKMDIKDYSALLSLMETGYVTRLKSHAREISHVACWVFAGANHVARIPQELLSRFLKVSIKPYSEQEFREVAFSVLTKRESVDPEIANLIVQRLSGKTQDIRDAVRLGRLAISKTDVDKLLPLMQL